MLDLKSLINHKYLSKLLGRLIVRVDDYLYGPGVQIAPFHLFINWLWGWIWWCVFLVPPTALHLKMKKKKEVTHFKMSNIMWNQLRNCYVLDLYSPNILPVFKQTVRKQCMIKTWSFKTVIILNPVAKSSQHCSFWMSLLSDKPILGLVPNNYLMTWIRFDQGDIQNVQCWRGSRSRAENHWFIRRAKWHLHGMQRDA